MHTFIYTMNNNCTTIKIEDTTWPEVTEAFFKYLQACGFVLTREMFAEEVQEKFGENL